MQASSKVRLLIFKSSKKQSLAARCLYRCYWRDWAPDLSLGDVVTLLGQVSGALHLSLCLFGSGTVSLQTYHCVGLIAILWRCLRFSAHGCCTFGGQNCILIHSGTWQKSAYSCGKQYLKYRRWRCKRKSDSKQCG